MAFWVLGWLGLRMMQVIGVDVCLVGMGNFGVDMGCSVIITGNLLHSCAKVHEAIELPFGEVSGVGSGIGVLVGSRSPMGDFSPQLV